MRSPTRVFPGLALLACALLFAPAEAHADPIQITSGYFAAAAPSPSDRFRTFGYDFRGNGLSLRGSEPDGRGQRAGWNCTPSPCAAGSSFNVTHAGGLNTWIPSNALTFNGQSYIGWATGTLNFVTGEMPWPASGESVIMLTTHFTMTGSITFQPHAYGTPLQEPFFVANVYGSGIATLRLTRVFSDYYYVTAVWFDFQPQTTTPTPEPVTLILLGSGLAGLAAQRRRTRRSGKRIAVRHEGM